MGGKRLQALVMELLGNAGIFGATVWTKGNGFIKRGKSTLHLEGVSINMTLIIEVIDQQKKLEPLLPELCRIIGETTA